VAALLELDRLKDLRWLSAALLRLLDPPLVLRSPSLECSTAPVRREGLGCGATEHELVRAGTHATFFGNATVNGVPTTYRIDVDDLGEPGAGRDTFRVQTAGGYSAGGVLTHGNIQIHN
jgi:hypothetical protein